MEVAEASSCAELGVLGAATNCTVPSRCAPLAQFDGEGGTSGGFGMRDGGGPGARGGVSDVAVRDDAGDSGSRDDPGGSGVAGARDMTLEGLAVSSPVIAGVGDVDPRLLKSGQSDSAGTVY